MNRYIINIELQAANESDYRRLHQEMKIESFSLVQKRPSMKSFSRFNPEQYRRESDTIGDVNGAVLRAAERTGKKCAFTVMREKKS